MSNCTCASTWSGWDRLCPAGCTDPRTLPLKVNQERQFKEHEEAMLIQNVKESDDCSFERVDSPSKGVQRFFCIDILKVI